MKSDSSINSKALGKLLKRYKLITRKKQEISKAAKKRSVTWSFLNRFSRKIEFKESITNINKEI